MSSEPISPSNNILIQPSSGLAPIAESTSPVLSEIIKRSLIHVQTSKKLSRLHRIGEHELLWPDYQLVCVFAEQLHVPPETVLLDLIAPTLVYTPFETSLINGSFVNLVVGPRLKGISFPPAIDGLQIEKLNVLPIDLCTLDISSFPNLTELRCHENQLTNIDLSPATNLTHLSCFQNQLTELDLSPVKNLIMLECGLNKLSDLDFSQVSNLALFSCMDNQLSKLDLSKIYMLKSLNCSINQLTELDLSRVSTLTELSCGLNQLTQLDLSKLPNLKWLNCRGNQLTKLDLSSVPNLTALDCGENYLTELNIRPLRCLKDLGYPSGRLHQRPDQNFE